MDQDENPNVEPQPDPTDALHPKERSPYPRIMVDPLIGLPALDAGPDAPILTSEQVKEMLADFP